MHFLNIVGPITPWITPIKPQNGEYDICHFQIVLVQIASWDPPRQIEDPFKSMKNKQPISRNIESITSENSTLFCYKIVTVIFKMNLINLSFCILQSFSINEYGLKAKWKPYLESTSLIWGSKLSLNAGIFYPFTNPSLYLWPFLLVSQSEYICLFRAGF